MPLLPLEYIRHIIDETEYLMAAKHNLHKEDFLHNATLTRAFVRSLEIIGEASKKVPFEFKERYQNVRLLAVLSG